MLLKHIMDTLNFGLSIVNNLSEMKLWDTSENQSYSIFSSIILDEFLKNIYLERASSKQIHKAVTLIGYGW